MVFHSASNADSAAQGLNMTVVGGRHVRVAVLTSDRKGVGASRDVEYEPRRSVFVGNLPFNVQVSMGPRLEGSWCSAAARDSPGSP